MARICLISPAQLATNPRLLRNADGLAAAGHAVTVIYAHHQPRFAPYDAAIRAHARWQARALDFCGTSRGRFRWQVARFRSHVFRRAFARRLDERSLLRNLGYFGPELYHAARSVPADLYIAQQQQTVVPAALAARRVGASYAVDVEDLLTENPSEQVTQIRAIETRYFAAAAFLSTMSDAAADYLLQQYPTISRPLVLHNCPSLAERDLPPPSARPAAAIPTLYWFGQTVGPHSCAEMVLRALARLKQPAWLVLRGRALPDYVARLHRMAGELGIPDALVIAPPAAPDAMVPLAGEHPVCLGTQPGAQLFHQLAIGNKVCTGILAGAALGLSDTIAHRRLVSNHPGFAFLFRDEDDSALASQLQRLFDDPNRLTQMRETSWRLGESDFNWEVQSRSLVDRVAALFSSR